MPFYITLKFFLALSDFVFDPILKSWWGSGIPLPLLVAIINEAGGTSKDLKRKVKSSDKSQGFRSSCSLSITNARILFS